MIYSDLTLVSAILMRKQFLRQRLNTIGKKHKFKIFIRLNGLKSINL
jgi:hypothetical protein